MAVSSTLLQNDKLRLITIERAEKFISHEQWRDVNLFSAVYGRPTPAKVSVWSPPVPDDVATHTDAVSVHEALRAEYSSVHFGQRFGPSWATHWFRVEVSLRPEHASHEVHFLWDNGSEALVYDADGKPLQGLYGSQGDDQRIEMLLTPDASGNESFVLYIEMACNGLFGNPADGGFLQPPDSNKTFELSKAEVRPVNRPAWALYWDFELILGMAKELSKKGQRAWQAAHCLEKIIQTVYVGKEETYVQAQAIANEFLSQRNGDSQHTISAIGHCHIDTAWLWAYSETRRKVARSWSTQLRLAEQFPGYVFAASQAQQFEWLKMSHPSLFEEIRRAVISGSFYPAGGTWVEMDCNIPNGESLIRQFLIGQLFFLKEFGAACTEFWLPDTFGYCSQLPQIMRGVGIHHFLTQKLSWNLINKFPHNTFHWQGLDGSKVLAHFPPADTYCAKGTVKEIVYTVENFKNKSTSKNSMLLFGIGDGGGGPQRCMLERLVRSKNVDQLPKVNFESPRSFFERIAREPDHPVWVGELYFELHRGTYTTHSRLKAANRSNEILLRNTEILSSFAVAIRRDFEYPHIHLERLWKLLLLNQFHDVIPGTSIGAVYVDAHAHHREIREKGNRLLQNVLEVFCAADENPPEAFFLFNPLSWERSSVQILPLGIEGPQLVKSSHNAGYIGRSLGLFWAPSLGIISAGDAVRTPGKLSAVRDGDRIILENNYLRAEITGDGRLASVIHVSTGRECIDRGSFGNQFCVFEDIPFFWDAWDCMEYHLDKRTDLKGMHVARTPRAPSIGVSGVEIVESGPLRCSVAFSVKISDVSSISQIISLDCCSEYLDFDTLVCWHESHKFLKVEFPLAVRSDNATYHTQFGVSQRPTHRNTSWDIGAKISAFDYFYFELAKFEVVGHYWADLSEYGFGTALLSDCKYGFACEGNLMRLSLLRSPKQPDDTADMGTHVFKYALYPHKGDHAIGGVMRAGFEFNHPVLTRLGLSAASSPLSFFAVDVPNVFVETVKLPEVPVGTRGELGLIVRLWETHGGRGVACLSTILPVNIAYLTDLLERKIEELKSPVALHRHTEGSTIRIAFRPFEIFTLFIGIDAKLF